jgi:threonine dehydrogenase-like Zn-dependent dehydrogenase
MKAIVFYDRGDIRLDDVPEPELQASTDAIIRLTASAICGTDLHFLRGTVSGMKKGTIFGHEGHDRLAVNKRFFQQQRGDG